MEVQKIGDAQKELKKRGEKFEDVVVVVGYESAYAVHVHEDIEMKLKGQSRPSGIGEYWGPHGQAKFLEQPARANSPRYAGIVRDVLEKGGTLKKALLAAGLELQRDSQELVPVEYGNLKASAFTQVES